MTRPDQPVIAQPPSSNGHEPSTGELMSRLTREVSRLVRDELQLARIEAVRAGKRAGMGAGALGAAGLFAWFAAGCLLAAAVLGLATVMSPWAAALLVGLALLVVAGLSGLTGRAMLRRTTIGGLPEDITDNIRADIRTVKEHAKR